jgi:hypothetical protein
MKWVAIGLGASLLALAVGALALTTRGGGQSTRSVTPTAASAPLGVTIPAAASQPSLPVPSTTKQARSGATPSKTCQSGGESDPNGDDRSNARNCSSSSSRDDQAGDNASGDNAGDDQAGDNASGDNTGDNQAGDNAGGNQP